MSKKSKKIKGGGLVFSTDKETMASLFDGLTVSGQSADEDITKNQNEADQEDIKNYSKDKVRIWLDRKSRGGKEATIIEGITCSADELKQLATFIKTTCGVGGSAKEGQIIIQGNQRDKILELLKQKGFMDVKKAGG